MKTRLFSGWKTRLQVMCLAAVCCVALGAASGAMAQETRLRPRKPRQHR